MQICFEQREERELENIIEAVLFSSGEPVSFAELADALEINKNEAQDIILKFAESYNLKNTGLEVIILEDNAQLIARAEHIDYIRKVLKSGIRQTRALSKPALEILAIVAYNQPVTRNYIEQIRGVDCVYMLGSLMERGYIEEKGVLEVPGRPRLYGTTIKFLAQFGLSDLSGLPEIEKFRDSLIDKDDGGEII
jgi:segregation and condensation protein B